MADNNTITINDLDEIQSITDSHYLAVDSGTATAKITVENFNATATASAAQYAQAAADSASAASDSEDAAKGYKETVEQAINDASTIVSNAQTYANNAESSKNDASGYASAASTSASQAATSAGQAASYATGVQAYATEAKSWAQGGTGTRVDEETTNCLYYKNAAHTSETNAAASESNAASSESNAAISETNAATSENNALGYANAASASALKSEGYAVGTQNGTPAASGDPYYQDNAKYYKEEAATSASNASTSETNAGLSESAASGYANAADDSAEDSEAWAVGTRDGVDVPSTDPAYHNNAKYWADVAAGGVSGVSSFNGRSGNVVPASGDYAANIIEYVNTTSGLDATDVQDAIDELDSDLGTLDSSLATVAKTGAYSDLSGTPTLATVATSGSYNDLSNKPNLATVATSGSYSDLSNKPTLGTAAAKNSTNAITQGSTDLAESGAVFTGLAGKANKSTVKTATLSAGSTTVTFTQLPTTGDYLIDFFTSTGINYTEIDTSTSGQVTLTYEEQDAAVTVSCEIKEA